MRQTSPLFTPIAPSQLRCGRFCLELSRPLVMGVVNVTPDSFSDGGCFLDPRAAIAHAFQLIEEGADIVDIGAESSRPGSNAISAEEEMRRLQPVLTGLRDATVPVSVDTVKAGVGNGRGKLCMPARSRPVCRSGTLAIRSVPRARARAVEKPPTIVTIRRSRPNRFKASRIDPSSSSGPSSKPRRETQICLPLA